MIGGFQYHVKIVFLLKCLQIPLPLSPISFRPGPSTIRHFFIEKPISVIIAEHLPLLPAHMRTYSETSTNPTLT